MLLLHPRSTRTDTLFPDTTLCRVGTDSTSSQLPLPTCLTSDVQVSLAPTPDAGPDSSKSACGSRNARAFQSVKRRRLLTVSNTIVILRLVSTLSLRCRLDGRTRATSSIRAATIASEIRISMSRVIQGSPGPFPAGPGRSEETTSDLQSLMRI